MNKNNLYSFYKNIVFWKWKFWKFFIAFLNCKLPRFRFRVSLSFRVTSFLTSLSVIPLAYNVATKLNHKNNTAPKMMFSIKPFFSKKFHFLQ